jgi:hypothetical protein
MLAGACAGIAQTRGRSAAAREDGPSRARPADECLTDSLSLNTGIYQLTGELVPLGGYCSNWRVVADPSPNTAEPRPSSSIAVYPGWADPLPNSRWISSYPTAANDTNGTYTFETCFCVKEGATNPRLHLELLADDKADIYLNGQLLGQTVPRYAFHNPPKVIDIAIAGLVQPGRNCLRVEVHNTNNIAMGLDVNGYVVSDGIGYEKPNCCDPTGVIMGTKFHDRNCNGVRDADDEGLRGWTIRLGSGETTTTDIQGNYYFFGVPVGVNTVEEVQQKGWRQSMPASGTYSVNVTPQGVLSGLNFGNCVGGDCFAITRTLNCTLRGTACCITVENLSGTPAVSVFLALPSSQRGSLSPSFFIFTNPLKPFGTSGPLCFSITGSDLPTGTRIPILITLHGAGGEECVRLDTVIVAPEIGMDAGPDTTICRGGEARLHASADQGILWSGGPLDCDTCREPVAHPDSTTSYTLRVVSSSGCVWYDAMTVFVAPEIGADAGPDTTICRGGEVRLHALATGPLLWSGGSLDCDICSDPLARPDSTTSYILRVTNPSGCVRYDTMTVFVAPEIGVDAGRDTTICRGGEVRLHALGAGPFLWSGGPLDCATCSDPVARPDSTTSYLLSSANGYGCVRYDTMTIRVLPRLRVIAYVPRDPRVKPGGSIVVPVVINSLEGEPLPGEIGFALRYNPHILRLDSLSLAGTILEGGSIERSEIRGGEVRATLASPPGVGVSHPGVLVNLAFTGFLGDTIFSDLPFELTIPEGPCREVLTSPGRVAIDSVCGLSLRLIMRDTGSYALDQSEPNPADKRARISFSLGLDGPATLAIYDASGAEIDRPIDGYLPAGSFTVEWDASRWPAGLYYYRLTAGEWSALKRMVIVR